MKVETRRYMIAAPVYRIEGWLAVEKLIPRATQNVIVSHDRCLISCRAESDATLIYMCLSDQPYGIELDEVALVADEAWHDEIVCDIAGLSVPLAALVFSLVEVTLSVPDHALFRRALRARDIVFLRVRRPRSRRHGEQVVATQ